MAFDFKKEYKEFYIPSSRPAIITVPAFNFIAVRGKGNPNDPDGEYSKALNMLYELDFSDKRLHHEMYLSDPRKVDPDKNKTVIRHPVRKQ